MILKMNTILENLAREFRRKALSVNKQCEVNVKSQMFDVLRYVP